MPTTGGRSQKRRAATWLAAACALTLTAAMACAAGASSVTGVNLERQGDVLLVNVEVSGPVAYATQMLEEPKRFVVDLQRSTLAVGQPARFPVDYGPVREVSIGPRRDEAATLRLSVLLSGEARCEARAGPQGGLVIAVQPEAGLPALVGRGARPGPRLAAPGGGLGEALWTQFLLAARALREQSATAPVALAALPGKPEEATAPPPAPVPSTGLATATEAAAGEQPVLGPAPALASLRAVALARAKASLSNGLRLPQYTLLAAGLTEVRASLPASLPAGREAASAPSAPHLNEGLTITGLSQVAGQDRFQVQISTNQPAAFSARRLMNPYRYVLELPNARVADDCARTIPVSGPLVARVDLAPKGSGTAVTLTLNERAECHTERSRDGQDILAVVEATAPAASTATAPRLAQAPSAPVAAAPDLLDLQFVDAELVEILSGLGKYSGKNIVVSDSVTGKLTLDLKQVTLQQALDMVTKLRGFDYVLLDERTYVVGTKEELAQLVPERAPRALRHVYAPQQASAKRLAARFGELYADTGITATAATDLNMVVFTNIPDQAQQQWLETVLPGLDLKAPDTYEMVTLQHVLAAKLIPDLQKWVPAIKITAPEGVPANVLRLEGPAEAIEEAKKMLALLDVDPTAVRLPTEPVRVVKDVDYMPIENVVTLVTGQFGEQVRVTPIEAPEGTRPPLVGGKSETQGRLQQAGRVIIEGDKSVVEQVVAFIDQIDVPQPQVQLRAVVAEVRLTNDATRGFTWSLPGLSFQETEVVGGYRFGRFVRSPLGPFSASLEALVSESKAKILAEPNMTTQTEKTGHILVGSIIPYETTVPGEGTVTRSVNFQEIGLSLDFTPIVHSDDTVQLWLNPKVSTFTGFTPQGYPEVSTREASTILHVNDREIIVLGGLFQDQEIVTKSGIPFLKDWPIIGQLFSFRDKSRIKTEIVFMAEITILRPALAAAAGAGGAG